MVAGVSVCCPVIATSKVPLCVPALAFTTTFGCVSFGSTFNVAVASPLTFVVEVIAALAASESTVIWVPAA